MKRLAIDFWVGIFVIIGIVCLAFLAIKVTTSTSFNIGKTNKTYILNAEFSNIGSLKVNAPVKVSGFIVGRIIGIYLDKSTYQSIVRMQINDNYKFSIDTSAQILTTGLLGEQYISLHSGADNSYLQDGSTINITSSALVLEDLIGKFMTNNISGKI